MHPALFPEALAMLAHVTTSRHTLFLADNLLWGDEIKTSPHSVLAQKMCFSLPPTFFLESFAHHRVHILNGDGGAWRGLDIPSAKGAFQGSQRQRQPHPKQEPPQASLDPSQKPLMASSE